MRFFYAAEDIRSIWRISYYAAVMLYSMNTEQGFAMEMLGTPHRKVIEINGLQLIGIDKDEGENLLNDVENV